MKLLILVISVIPNLKNYERSVKTPCYCNNIFLGSILRLFNITKCTKPIGEDKALMPTQAKNLWPSALIVTHRNFHKRAVETNVHVCIYLIIGKGQIAQKTILRNLVEPLSRPRFFGYV